MKSFSLLNIQARADAMSLKQIQLIALEAKDLSSDMKSTQCAVYGIMVPCFFFSLWYKIHHPIYNVQEKCIRSLVN